MNCKQPRTLTSGLTVPCGKCLACRIHKRQEWTIRCLHELEVCKDALFITLTYSDNYVPEYQSLRKKHLQNFFKRLRQRSKKYGQTIRYFACGEYGDRTGRPHYHAIVFGLPYNETSKKIIRESWPFCDWDNPCIRKDSFGMAEPDSIRYVAQYIDKKFSGRLAKHEYDDKSREPVFKISSLGIGRDYIDKYYKELKQNLSITLNGIHHSLPRYYITRLDLDLSKVKDSLLIDENKRFRQITDYKNLDSCNTREEKIEYYKNLNKYNKSISKSRVQHDKNLKSKLSLKKREKI